MLRLSENVVFSREILCLVQKHGNSVAVHARQVLSFFITKSALEITSAIGEKLRPVALTKEKISLMRKLVAMHTH